MSGAATIGSIGVGICYGHVPPIPMTGVVSTGSDTVKIGGVGAASTGSIVLGLCGHPGVLAATSTTVIVGDSAKGRSGDPFVGIFTGILTTGEDTVQIGD